MREKLNKKELNRKAFTAGVFFVITQLIVRGISFLTTPIYTRLVSTAQYGEIRVYESWLLITVPIMSLCLYRSVERAKFDYPEKFEEYVSAVQTLSYLSIVGCFTIVTLFFRKAFMSFCNMNQLMYIFMILYTLGYTAILFFQRREKQLLRYKHSTLLTMLTMIPATVLSIFLLYVGGITGKQNQLVNLRVIGFYTPQIIGGFAVALLMWKQGRLCLKKEYWKYAVSFSLPLIPEMLSIQIMNQSDKIMIQKMVDEHSAGLFALGTTVSFIIWIIEDSVWNAWLPWLYEKMSRCETGEIREPWMKIVHIFAYISWMLVALAPEIVLILGGKKYYDSIYLIAPMVTGTLFRFFSYCYTAVQNYHKRTQYVALGTVVAMLINIVLNYICIIAFGYQAAAYTTAVSYFLLMIIQGYLEKKITGERIAPLSQMTLLSIVFFGVNIITMIMFKWKWYVRYMVVLVVTVMMIKRMWTFTQQLLRQMKRR